MYCRCQEFFKSIHVDTRPVVEATVKLCITMLILSKIVSFSESQKSIQGQLTYFGLKQHLG